MEGISAVAAADKALSLFNAVISGLKNNAGAPKSLIDVAKVARVEPLCIIDSDCIHLDFMPDVMQTLQSIFASYYLQAVNALGTTIDGVTVAKRLAPLNPNAFSDGAFDWRMSLESYKYRLPTTHNHLAVSMEKAANPMKANPMEADRDASGDIKESVALSIGKIYNVTIKSNESSAVVPVSIRLLANTMPSNSLVNMFTFQTDEDMDFKERFHSWRSGRISLINDLVLCNDILDKQRKMLLKDNTTVYQQILNRENKNRLFSILSNTKSYSGASNIAIISTDTASKVEEKIYGKLKNLKQRNVIFDNTNLMILAVIDKNWERITFYYRGIAESSTLGIKDIKSFNKGSDNVSDMLKAFIAGSSPKI
jgi:hypothetical protein